MQPLNLVVLVSSYKNWKCHENRSKYDIDRRHLEGVSSIHTNTHPVNKFTPFHRAISDCGRALCDYDFREHPLLSLYSESVDE